MKEVDVESEVKRCKLCKHNPYVFFGTTPQLGVCQTHFNKFSELKFVDGKFYSANDKLSLTTEEVEWRS